MVPHSPIRALAFGFVCCWIAILAHEAAHFATGRIVYGTFHPTETIVDQVGTRWRALPVAAGPTATMLLLAACLAAAAQADRPGQMWTAFAFAVGNASRVMLIGPSTILATGQNDELTVGH